MKSMEEYINDIYERYEESEKNHEVYKKVRMTRKRPLTTLCSVTACLLIACVCFISYAKFNTTPIIKDTPVFVEKNENKDNSVTYTEYISVNSLLEIDILKEICEKSEAIILINDFERREVVSEVKKRKVSVKTNGVFYIEQILKGKNTILQNQIEYSTLGGAISLSVLEKDQSYNWEEWEKLNIGCNIAEEEKANTYYEQVIERAEKLEKGKRYMVFLTKEEGEEKYSLSHLVYGIMEYDPVTNKVKNIDTGEFEEFDWDLLTDK